MVGIEHKINAKPHRYAGFDADELRHVLTKRTGIPFDKLRRIPLPTLREWMDDNLLAFAHFFNEENKNSG